MSFLSIFFKASCPLIDFATLGGTDPSILGEEVLGKSGPCSQLWIWSASLLVSKTFYSSSWPHLAPKIHQTTANHQYPAKQNIQPDYHGFTVNCETVTLSFSTWFIQIYIQNIQKRHIHEYPTLFAGTYACWLRKLFFGYWWLSSNLKLLQGYWLIIYMYIYIYWLVVWTPLKNTSQLGWLFPIYGKIKNVPNYQPVYIYILLTFYMIRNMCVFRVNPSPRNRGEIPWCPGGPCSTTISTFLCRDSRLRGWQNMTALMGHQPYPMTDPVVW